MKSASEEFLQAQVAGFLRSNHSGIWYHIRQENQGSAQWNQKGKRLGVRSGVADLLVHFGSRTAYFELKTKAGRQSKTQKDFERDCHQSGIPYYVIRSIDDFITAYSEQLPS